VRNFNGNFLPESIEESLSLRSALIIWDMQKGIAPRVNEMAGIVDMIGKLRVAASERAAPTIFSQHYSIPLRWEARGYVHSRWMQSGRKSPDEMELLMPFGGTKMQFVDGLAPGDDDIVLPKIRASFFFGTPLLSILKSCQIETLILTGVATDKGILATARDANMLGIFPVVVSDATGAFSELDHEFGLEAARQVGQVVSVSECLELWRP
jgi:nicotinamidase-related amidase